MTLQYTLSTKRRQQRPAIRQHQPSGIGKRCTLLLALLWLPLTTTEAFAVASSSTSFDSALSRRRQRRATTTTVLESSTVAQQHFGGHHPFATKCSSSISSSSPTTDGNKRQSKDEDQSLSFSKLSKSWFAATPSSRSNNIRKRNKNNKQSSSRSSATSTSSQSNTSTYNDYQRRKNAWATKYCSVDSLRQTFGANHNKLWGDLDAPTARRLYKTLLPKALLDLYKLGVEPQDLAPLAYRARVAAKLYARERCQVPARYLARWYDGFRQWRRYGSFDTTGMTYQQVWNKYAHAVLNDVELHASDLSEEDVTAMICCKILEKSCTTNEMVDRLVLSNTNNNNKKKNRADQVDLQHFTDTLERDVRLLLKLEQQEHSTQDDDNDEKKQLQQLTAKRFRMLKRIVKLKQRIRKSQSSMQESSSRLFDETKEWE